MTTIHPELKKAIKNNKLVVFAGSGTSANCGFPNWKQLVLDILTTLEIQEPLYQHFKPLVEADKLTPLQMLNMLEEKEKATVLDTLTEKIRLTEDTNLDIQKKIIELTPKIITTNYDKSFEEAWGPSARIIPNNDPFSLWKLKEYNEYIFKIHGDITYPFECVLFEKQFVKLYAKESFWIGFMNLLMNSTVLFIGFSMSDPYVNSILIKIKEMFSGLTNKHFIITTDKHFEVAELKDIIIPIVIPSYDDLNKTLDDLIPFVTNLPPRPYTKLIGRDNEMAEIMKYLAGNVSVTIIEGAPGVGKKSLALETGYACLFKTTISLKKQARFNNVIWLSLGDIQKTSSYLNTIFDTIGRAFDSEKITKISENELWKKDWEVYKLLELNKTLIILDDFEMLEESGELLKWLQKIPGNCKVIITTENLSIPGNKKELKGLDENSAYEFISNEINAATLSQKMIAADLKTLVEQTKGNPRALQLAVGQIKQGTMNMEDLRIAQTRLVMEKLHDDAWEQLSEEFKKFLFLFSVFSNSNSVDKEALVKACDHFCIDFDAASKQCESLNFVTLIGD